MLPVESWSPTQLETFFALPMTASVPAFTTEFDYVNAAEWEGLGDVDIHAVPGEVRVLTHRPRGVARNIWRRWCAEWQREVREHMPLCVLLVVVP